MEQEKTELLKGTLDMLILKVVAFGPIHGYAISRRIQQISRDFFQVPEGSLYPALYRLEDRGWLQAKWEETETGREAKFYSLTRAGRKRCEERARSSRAREILTGEEVATAVGSVRGTWWIFFSVRAEPGARNQ